MKRMELIAYNFARLRKERGLTQDELTDLARYKSKGYIGQIEANLAKSFSARAEEKWAKIFKVSIAEFFLEPGQIIADAQSLINMIRKPEYAEQSSIDDDFRRKQTELHRKFGKAKKKTA